MMGNLGATLEEVAWVSTGYIVANVIILPLTPWLSARFGRRNYYTGSIILFTVASFFCGNARSPRGARYSGASSRASAAARSSRRHRRSCSTSSRSRNAAPPPRSSAWASWWARRSARPWAAGSPTTIPGPGSSTSTSRWASWRRSSPGRTCPEPKYKVQEDAGVDWLGLLFLIMGVGALQILLERGESKDWFESTEIVIETCIAAFGMIAFVLARAHAPSTRW